MLHRLSRCDVGVAHRAEEIAARWIGQNEDQSLQEARVLDQRGAEDARTLQVSNNMNPDTESDSVMVVEVPDTDSRHYRDGDESENFSELTTQAADEKPPVVPPKTKSIASYLD